MSHICLTWAFIIDLQAIAKWDKFPTYQRSAVFVSKLLFLKTLKFHPGLPKPFSLLLLLLLSAGCCCCCYFRWCCCCCCPRQWQRVVVFVAVVVVVAVAVVVVVVAAIVVSLRLRLALFVSFLLLLSERVFISCSLLAAAFVCSSYKERRYSSINSTSYLRFPFLVYILMKAKIGKPLYSRNLQHLMKDFEAVATITKHHLTFILFWTTENIN